MNLLLSSAGRRGALIQLLKQEAARFGGKVYAVDAGAWSAACQLAAGWIRVPPCSSPMFVPTVIDFCRTHDVRLIIPTIDPELPVYAEHRGEFEAAGIGVCVSSPQTVAICADKHRTEQFFRAAGLPTVRSFELSAAAEGNGVRYPVIVKPRFGSASQSVHRAADAEELAFYLKRTPHPIVQEHAVGEEFTVNLFVGRDGRCRAAVPHRRISTRGGEVSQGVTVQHRELMGIADRIAAALPGAFGPMCYQVFVETRGVTSERGCREAEACDPHSSHNGTVDESPEGPTIRLIELNARFGGGYPLAHAAGANFIRWLILDRLGRPIPESCLNWQAGLIMSRWDDAVFWTRETAEQAAA